MQALRPPAHGCSGPDFKRFLLSRSLSIPTMRRLRGIPRAAARRISRVTVMFFSPRSRLETYVRWRPASAASSS